jgi:DNA repair exonuclease SbcCD ATPase subunit
MNRRITTVILWVLVIGCCSYGALLWADYNGRSRQLDELQEQVSRLPEISDRNLALQKIQAQLEELQRLRRNRLELDELAAKIDALRRTQAQRTNDAQRAGGEHVRRLESENAQLRAELEQFKTAPGTLEARQSVDASQLEHISRFFKSYARNNAGRYPADFSELRYYLPANIYPTIETNRFEILANDGSGDSDGSQQALVRTRFEVEPNSRLYLFADGHVEARAAP